MRKFRIAVILVNYNSSSYTIDCIRSIEQQTDESLQYQIIVVDNNSSDEEYVKLNAIKDKMNVSVHRSRINIGFSGANMMGVQLANADYYYFLNNDTVLLNDCLSILTGFMDSEPSAANCSGEMFIENGEYEYNFRNFPNLAVKLLGSGFLRIFNPLSYPSRHVRFKTPTAVDLVNGSSMFIRAKPFEEVGGFDIVYFLYCEEEDIALRLRRLGFKTYLVPSAHYKHFISKSSTGGDFNPLYLREFYISLLYYFAKNYNSFHKLGIQVFYFFKLLRKFYKDLRYISLAFFVLRGAPMKNSLRFKQTINSPL
jgi:GT2 family glycosyltransferase